jgi:TRAP-type uncharacterized transport system fused permease subunit
MFEERTTMDQFEVGAGWKDRGLRSRLAFIVAVIWSVYTLSYLCNIFFYLGVVIYPITHRTISAGLISILVFLLYAPKRGMSREKLRWYDILPVLSVIVGCAYIAVNANNLVAEGRLISHTFEMILASFLFLSVIEATRRTIGWILPGLVIFFFFYAIYSNQLPGFLHSTGFSYSMMFGWMYLSAEGFWGMVHHLWGFSQGIRGKSIF